MQYSWWSSVHTFSQICKLQTVCSQLTQYKRSLQKESTQPSKSLKYSKSDSMNKDTHFCFSFCSAAGRIWKNLIAANKIKPAAQAEAGPLPSCQSQVWFGLPSYKNTHCKGSSAEEKMPVLKSLKSKYMEDET